MKFSRMRNASIRVLSVTLAALMTVSSPMHVIAEQDADVPDVVVTEISENTPVENVNADEIVDANEECIEVAPQEIPEEEALQEAPVPAEEITVREETEVVMEVVEEITENEIEVVAEETPAAVSSSFVLGNTAMGGDYDVSYEIHYTDRDTHSRTFADTVYGTVPNGTSLYVVVPSQVIDRETGDIWTTEEETGYQKIWGPGTKIMYIEYDLTGHLDEPEDPYADAKGILAEWIDTAKTADSELLGVSKDRIPTTNVVIKKPGQANLRLLTAAASIDDADMHTVYIIVNGTFYPTGICLKETYGDKIIYSNDVMDEFDTDEGHFIVHMFHITRGNVATEDGNGCRHEYMETAHLDPSCLVRGVTKKTCTECGYEVITYHASLGHIDENGDSACDRCGQRVYEEEVGNKITTELSFNGKDYSLNWTLVDEDFKGGCLYVADNGIPVSELGGFGKNTSYSSTGLFDFFIRDFSNGSSINGDLLKQFDEGGTTAYAQLLTEADAVTYRPLMAAGDYVTQTGDGSVLTVIKTDGTATTVDADADFEVRPAVILSKPYTEAAQHAHWNIGDQITRSIDGVEYSFTCIDENYSDIQGNHTQSALFLMDDVIPAGYGGEYRSEVNSAGMDVQVWYPGPIANFGNNNNYKYSNVRKFLDKETVFTAAEIAIGSPNAYIGSTAEGKFSQTTDRDLKSYSIGYQSMTAKLFILSLEEAIKYSQYLWRFGSSADNPQKVMEATCGAYWLRSPVGTNNDYPNTGLCYVVDLELGNIHPEYVKPAGGTGDIYLDTQTTVGVRPAFTLPNV